MTRSRTSSRTSCAEDGSSFNFSDIRPSPFSLSLQTMNRMSENDKACEKKDAIFLEDYVAPLLRVLRYACIWPTKSFSFKILITTGMTIVFISTNFVLLFSEIMSLALINDLKLFANIIGVIGMHAAGLLKWCYCIWKSNEVIDIMTKLEKCHVFCQRIVKDEEGRQIYRNKMEYMRKYSNLFLWWWTFACIYGVLHWCANPLVLGWSLDEIDSINHTVKNRNLPFFIWNPLNIDNIYAYACMYVMQTIGGLSPVLGIICYDTFYVTMLMVICVQFEYINIMITKIEFNNVPEAMLILESKLKNCVDCHTEITEFLKMLQIFSSPTMFAQCIETIVILCLVSFEASVIKIALDMESILKLWSLLEYFLCSAIQLYFFCFFATRLQYLGLQITNSVYSCGWELVVFEKKVDLMTRLKHRNIVRLVQTIIVQAQRPIVLTGGPFYILSLETFRTIIGVAMSNSVMLRTISVVE